MRIMAALLLLLGLLGPTGILAAAPLLGAPDFLPSPEHPVGWRGDGTGCFPGAIPPTVWDETTGTGIRWKTPLPGFANSSVIVVGDRIFTTAEPYWLLCLDADTGKELWRREVFWPTTLAAEQADEAKATFDDAWALVQKTSQGVRSMGALVYSFQGKEVTEPERERAKALWSTLQRTYGIRLPLWMDTGYAVPTPASDGACVYAKFGHGSVGCYDLDGTLRWLKKMPLADWDPEAYATSPVLLDGRLFLTFGPNTARSKDKSKGQALMALDARTGETLWQSEPFRLIGSFSGTPAVVRVGDVALLVAPGGAVVRASDGKVLARDTGMCASGSSPVGSGDGVYFCNAGGNDCDQLLAVRYGLTDPDTLTTETVFTAKIANGRYFGSPLVADGRAYAKCATNGELAVVEGTTGKVLAQRNGRSGRPWASMGGWSYPSPALAGGLLVIGGRGRVDGVDKTSITIAKPGDDPQAVALNWLSESVGSSPFFAGSRMYIRSTGSVYCIEAAR